MKPNERQKMCATCDGRIPLDANLCPYCSTEQGTSGQVYLQHKSIQESLTSSLYPPPYAAKNTSNPSQFQEPMSEKRSEKKFQTAPVASSPHISLDNTEEQSVEEKNSFWPLLLLSVGANLLVLGLLQFFFSDNGLLTLQWDSSYWFIYCLAALPLFYLGFKKIQST